MTRILDNKVAMVTGGSSGIGRATASAFAREGAKVVVADVNREGGEETVKMIKEAGGESVFIRTDVSKAADVEALIKKTIETYGRLDCAHNNAGVGPAEGLAADYTESDWGWIINVNLKGVWLCMKYEIPQMLRQCSGAIVNTSSIAGLVGHSRSAIYVASKHGIVGLTKGAALDYASAGIRINAVCPGTILTPMVEEIFAGAEGHEEESKAMHPIGRLGRPEEVAEAVVWLCSDAASFITGHAMAVDGGWVSK